jgi:hypothetical protein
MDRVSAYSEGATIMKALLRATAVSMFLVLLATAPALAHDRTASTRINLNANKSVVDPGEKVKFSGKLNSDWNKCRKWKNVHLFRNGSKVASKQTKKNGKFQFSRQVNSTSNWRVKFNGKDWGTHPHSHHCLESVSDTIHIRVRGGGGGGGAVADAGGGSGGTTVVAGVGGAGDTAVLAAGGASALTGSDIADPAKAAIALGAIGLVAAVLTRRRDRATPPPAPSATP